MSINHIELKPHMLASLYPTSLLETAGAQTVNSPAVSLEIKKEERLSTPPPPAAAVPAKPAEAGHAAPVKMLGTNKKNILVVVENRNLPFLPEDELAFLSSILAACKLSLADIGVVNRAGTDPDHITTLINDSAKSVLLFGIEPLSIGLPIDFPQFQLQKFNGRTYIHAPALAALESDKELKKQLWNSLKTLFGL